MFFKMTSPHSLTLITETEDGDIKPLAIFRSFLSVALMDKVSNINRVLKKESSSSMSFLLREMVEGRLCFIRMFCSEELKFTLVISLIFESIDKIPGRDRTQISLLVWDKLLP